ncbi:MAG: GatB/YqeY domain-containing protein [Candidatus Wallbacteria bacterium]|nr:GatB/YqeY domain-containing protein [Candidatus Wallbacteria bacterium]
MIAATIKKQQLECLKAGQKDKCTFLSTLYSEIVMIGKNGGNRETTDQEALAVIRKFKKNADEILRVGNPAQKDAAVQEIEWLNSYLPSQMTETELREAIIGIAKTLQNPNVGAVMKELKTKHEGQFDGKTASGLVKMLLEQKQA